MTLGYLGYLRGSILFLSLLIAQVTQAGPIHWVKGQFTNHPARTKLLTAGISAGVAAYGLHNCRSTRSVEDCDGKYGSAWVIFGAGTGLNLLMIPISEKIGGWQGNLISYGGSAAQLGHGIYEWRGGTNALGDKVDLSNIHICHKERCED